MILDRHNIHAFIAGERTLLLIPRGDEPGHAPPHHAGARIPLVPGFGRKATCTLLVTRVTDAALGDIDDEQARELGHRDVDEWMAAWVAEHGLFNESARVWRVRVRVDPTEPDRLLPATAGMKGPRALQPHTSQQSIALRDAGERPDEHADAASRRHAHAVEHERVDQLLNERARLPLIERLRLAEADAEARGIRITTEQRAIARRIRVLEERVYAPADRYADAETPA